MASSAGRWLAAQLIGSSGRVLGIDGECSEGWIAMDAARQQRGSDTPGSPPESPVPLDPSQQAVVDASTHESFAVLGAAGSGRTTTLIETVVNAIDRGVTPENILVIGANRRTAARLRDRIQARLQRATRGASLGRTLPSVAMEIIAEHRAHEGDRAPRLLTGSQQDAILQDLLAGEVTDYERNGTWRWNESLDPQTLLLRGFRNEVRDLLAAMVELGVSAEELRALSSHGRPAGSDHHDEQWVAQNRFRMHWASFADFAERYFDVLEAGYEGVLDTPMACREAIRVLENEDEHRSAFADVELILVDDAQELTASARALMFALARRGARVVTFGNPDTATGAFHGGQAAFAGGWESPATHEPVPVRTLTHVYRHGSAIREVVSALSQSIGTSSTDLAYRRAATACDDTGVAFVATAATSVEAENAVVQFLRWQHLSNGVPWSQMAVIDRSGASLTQLSRRLERARVPAAVCGAPTFAQDATVQAILTMAEIVEAGVATGQQLESVLQSPLYGIDPLQLRALRRLAYFSQFDSDGDIRAGVDAGAEIGVETRAGAAESQRRQPTRSGTDVLAHAVTQAVCEPTADDASGGTTARIEQILESANSNLLWPTTVRSMYASLDALRRMRARHLAYEPVDNVLYEAWHDDDRADRWRSIALSSAPGADEMNRRLDAVVALFERAKRLVEREPGTSLGSFVAKWRSADVPEDTLIARSQQDAVSLLTPSAALDTEFRVVVVTGVNEGVWPNLRLRDTLLGAGRLAEVREGSEAVNVMDRRRSVLHDELRMLNCAISRASETVLVSAVSSQDIQPAQVLRGLPLEQLPAQFQGLVEVLHLNDAGGAAQVDDVSSASSDVGDAQSEQSDSYQGPVGELTPEGLAAMLRRRLVRSALSGSMEARTQGNEIVQLSGASNEQSTTVAMNSDEQDERYLRALARLARSGVRSADPNNWFGARGRSTSAPIIQVADGEATLRLSPSSMASLRDCPVDVFLSDQIATPPSQPQWLGTMIHDLAQHQDDYESHEQMKLEALRRVDEYPIESAWMREVLRTQAIRAVTGLWDYLKQAEAVLGRETRFVSTHQVQAVGTDDDPVCVDVQVRGQIDRIERCNGAARIVDFKTGTNRDTKVEENPQLISYRLACVRGDIPGLSAGLEFDSAALVYPRISYRKRTWHQSELTSESAFDIDQIVQEFTALAFARVGVNVNADSQGSPIITGEPRFRRNIQEHCGAGPYGPHRAHCDLHTIPEVCA